MRIENPGSGGVDRTGKIADRSTASSPRTVRTDTATTMHVASPELEALVNAASQLPDVRPEVVDNVSRRLALGQTGNLTQTAGALLDGLNRPSTGARNRVTDGVSTSGEELAGELDQLPDVRAAIVEAVSRKVASGELTTPDALKRTAEAILG